MSPSPPPRAGTGPTPLRVELLYFDGCPNWETADERLRTLGAELGFTVDRRKVTGPDDHGAARFHGSPTILLDGRDPFWDGRAAAGFACRVFDTPDGRAGSPTIDQLRRTVIDARRTPHGPTRASRPGQTVI